ncbi:MAG: hypothetical protein R3324_01025, partial [Halobacteriales archaeon]|nr:hypothetical protein [Halobacteriales archaeon]
MTFLPDPFVEDYYEQLRAAREARFKAVRDSLTSDAVRQVVDTSYMYPSLPKSVIAAAGIANVPADSPVWQDIAVRAERQKADEGGNILTDIRDGAWSSLKGVSRTAMTAFDFLWEEGVSRSFRTLLGVTGLTDQGVMDPVTAWRKAGGSYGGEVLGLMLQGRFDDINLGSGFIPQSDDPKDTRRFERLVASGTDPQQAEQIVRQNFRPVTDIARQRAATGLTRGGRPISPGRFVADQLWVEPGTGPYNLVSGLLDATAQVVADPTAGLLKAGKVARLNRRMFGGIDEVGEAARLAERVRTVLVDGHPHRVVRGRAFNKFASTNEAQKL